MVARIRKERIEVDEWSGPVSPRHQYRTRIVVTKAKEGVSLSYEHEGVFSEGKPTVKKKVKMTVPDEAYEALWTSLEEGGVFSVEDAALPAETKSRVGVSVSTLEVSRGDRRAMIEYTRAELKRQSGEKKRALVERVKTWAEALTA